MPNVFSFRDLVAERNESATKARDAAWDEFLRTISVLRKAQDAMDAAHREYLRRDNEVRRVNGS
jgi:hypothetical protein